MKGYYTPYGYMGYVPEAEKFMLFTSEAEYIDYLRQLYVFNSPKPNRNRIGVPTLVFYHGSVKISIYFFKYRNNTAFLVEVGYCNSCTLWMYLEN